MDFEGYAAGSVLNANRQVGSLVGIAGVGVVLNSTTDWNRGAAFSFLVIAVVYLLAGIAAWQLIALPGRREAALTA